MKRVTTGEFVELVQARMERGMDYVVASEHLQTEDETQRSYNEIVEGDLARVDFADAEMRMLVWAEEQAYADDKYDAVGWQPPPADPELELLRFVDDVMDEAKIQRLHTAIRELLSRQEQDVIHAMFWGETSQADIARGLGISRQAVHSAYSRGLVKLREAFGLDPNGPAAPKVRLTQEQKTAEVLARQRRRGAGLDAKFRRMREAALA